MADVSKLVTNKNLELAADVSATVVVTHWLWDRVLGKEPLIKFLSDITDVGLTVAAGYAIFKIMRSQQWIKS